MPLTKITSGEFQDSSVSFSGIVTAGSFVSGNVGIATTRATQPFQIGAGSTIVIVDGMGELGIGTTNPTSKLQVVGDARVSGVVTAFDFYNDAEYPSVRPTLDLAFAQTKILDSRIIFTRASTATYVNSVGILTTAAVNQPRFDHNPATGESLGLLVEEARTNSITYSEQFDNAAWTKNSSTITANATTAPDGTLTADRLLETATTATFYVANFGGATATPGTYTASVFAKGDGSGRLLNMTLQQNGVYQQSYFNLATGVVSNVDGTLTASIQSLANGWFRCSVTGTSSVTTTLFIFTAAAAGENSVYGARAGSASAGIFLWGAQLEAGAFPTSYIPTTTATVTRAADVASMTGTNFSSWYNANAGTLLAYQRSLAGQDAYETATFLLSSSNPNAELIGIYSTNDYNRFYVYGNGNSANAENYLPVTPGTLTKNALAYQSNNVAAVRNGGTVATDTSVGIPTGIDRATLGSKLGDGYQKQQTIARLTYYPVRLPDAQLQTITL